MGETQTKNIQYQLLEHLQHTYEPYLQSKSIPGHPTYLKIQHQSSMPPIITEWTHKYPIIDCYQLMLKLNQQDWKRENTIYEYRKATYPYFVQVIYFQLQKQQCECANQRHRFSVYTEHIAYRLANFKLCKNIETNNNKHLQLEYYQSLSLDEGIYLLINTLHAYQLLAQQYCVNYPTIFTIGITEKAQVKVWINQNWALNNQHYRRIPQSLIIEEIVNLIEERMEADFEDILHSMYNYMNFTFDSIQQILSQYTINFHKGKVTLQKKITSKIYRENTETKRFTEKLTTEMTPVVATFPQKTVQPPSKNTDNTAKAPERRYLSQQYPKNHYPQTHTPYSCKKNTEATQNITANSPPKQSIKFTYQHAPQLSSKQQKPKTPTLKKQAEPAQIPLAFPNLIKTINHTNTNFNYISNTSKSKNTVPSHQNQKNSHAQSLVDRKLHLGARNKYQQKKYSPLQNTVQATQKKTQVSINHIPAQPPFRQKISVNRNHTDTSKRTAQRKSDSLIPVSQRKNEKQKVNIQDITSQFIILLQSDNKISQDDEANTQFETSPFHIDSPPPLQKSEEHFKTSSFVHYIEEIKEEDQEINYSFEQVI